MNVVRFPRHKLHACDGDDCFVCDAGLGWCVTCNGAESSLTTDCCGRELAFHEQDDVTAGTLDYTRQRGWFVPQAHEVRR